MAIWNVDYRQMFGNPTFHEILALVMSADIILNAFVAVDANFIACGCRLAYGYMIRKAVLLTSHTVTGMNPLVVVENQ